MTDDYCTIPLTQNKITIIDQQDSDLASIRWCAQKNPSGKFYALRGSRPRGFLHRVIMGRKLGRELLPGEMVDHIDGNGLNNRRDNLRLATASQNQWNKRKHRDNKSGFKGVSWKAALEKWQATIRVNGRSIHLGLFDTPEEAHKAYAIAAKEHFGEFAREE